MKSSTEKIINLNVIRTILTSTLPKTATIVGTVIKTIEEDNKQKSACITSTGIFKYNRKFVEEKITSHTDLFCLVMHELLHPLFGHLLGKTGIDKISNIGMDSIINAFICKTMTGASGNGSLFQSMYSPLGALESILRPDSFMTASKYCNVYALLYDHSYDCKKVSSAEIINAIKILEVDPEKSGDPTLLGDHGGNSSDGDNSDNDSEPQPQPLMDGLSEKDKETIVDELINKCSAYGSSMNIINAVLQVFKTHLSIRKAMLQKYATVSQFGKFTQDHRIPSVRLSPIPIAPSKRDIIMASIGFPPFVYHNRRVVNKASGAKLEIYIDVSGSVVHELPKILAIINNSNICPDIVYQFSTIVDEISFKKLSAGNIRTTYGTDFNCVAQSIIGHNTIKAIIFTDGESNMTPENIQELKRRGVKTFNILYGAKYFGNIFENFGPSVDIDHLV